MLVISRSSSKAANDAAKPFYPLPVRFPNLSSAHSRPSRWVRPFRRDCVDPIWAAAK